MASDAHGSAQKTSSDMPWMMGAGLVTALGVRSTFPFSPVQLRSYPSHFAHASWTSRHGFLLPPGKKHAHAAAKSATAPLEAAFPVSEHTEKPMDPMTDDEGNEASGEEVSASIEKALDADAPKAAKSAEENAEETTSEAEAESPTRVEDGEKDETSDEKPEVKEKPTERSGTLQNEGSRSSMSSVSLITSSTNGFDGSMMNGLQSLAQWEDDFHHPTGGQLGLLNAIQTIGGLGALPFAPYVSDGLKRRQAIMVGALIMWGATILQAAASSVGMFIGARFLVGFGLTFAANAAPMLVSELAYPPYRAPLTSMYNTMWYTGSIAILFETHKYVFSAAWTTFGCVAIPNSWASAAQVFLLWFAPESPQWLVRKGRDTQALQTLAYYHADGDETYPLVVCEFEEIKASLAVDQRATADTGWSSLLTQRGNRKRLGLIVSLAFFSQWSGNGLISFYLSAVFARIGIEDPAMQLLINGLLQIWNLLFAAGAAVFVDRLGRRTLFTASCAGMLVFFSLQTACSALFAETGGVSAAHGVIACIFLFYAAYDIAFTPLVLSYTVEILLFSVRAKGLSVFNLTISLSLIFNQYVNPIALASLGWKYYIVYCAWLAFELAFCFVFVVETKGLTVEETAVLFDGVTVTDNDAAEGTEIKATVGHALPEPEDRPRNSVGLGPGLGRSSQVTGRAVWTKAR
ncbi:hypothetical protein EW145_g5917 [Phellinidium pouzarii]|uniref:Major facilitator superfamily (MFS) profile domain-containing protein n=1 Tax=Phellinidium pouzarii TaxID=167371 RepID=A0A4S4KYC2_9AGAM|nr:hypothetical protein EW145_g5917 [Phellinidium pouzarii]